MAKPACDLSPMFVFTVFTADVPYVRTENKASQRGISVCTNAAPVTVGSPIKISLPSHPPVPLISGRGLLTQGATAAPSPPGRSNAHLFPKVLTAPDSPPQPSSTRRTLRSAQAWGGLRRGAAGKRCP